MGLHQGLGLADAVFVPDGDHIAVDGAHGADAGGGGVGQEHTVIGAALLQVIGLRRHDAYDGQGVGAHLQFLAHGVAAVIGQVDELSHHTDLFPVGNICVLNPPALGDLIAIDGKVILADTGERGGSNGIAADLQRKADGDSGRELL